MNKDFFPIVDKKLIEFIKEKKEKFGKTVIIPAHHYQQDVIVELSDFVGDSYKLALEASGDRRPDAEFIVFCGVRFMAEGASILAKSNQKVLTPEPKSGCPMADMVCPDFAEKAYNRMSELCENEIIPVIYMNSYADMKSFCGERGGTVCTSSNPKLIVEHYLNRGKSVFFSPDYNLGINTARQLDLSENEIVEVYKDGTLKNEENTKKAKLFIWDGYCHVHKVFSVEDVKNLRQKYPDITIIVHPESDEEVVNVSDLSGSTAQIYNAIKDAPEGSVWGVGTEYNFVHRIDQEFPNKTVLPLRKSICTNMQKITVAHLARALQSIEDYKAGAGDLLHELVVADKFKENAKKALQRMIDIVEGGKS